jgi:hypothetical protein
MGIPITGQILAGGALGELFPDGKKAILDIVLSFGIGGIR